MDPYKSGGQEAKTYDVPDKIADGQLGSEAGTSEGEIMLQSVLKKEEPGLCAQNSECAQSTDEEISNAIRTEEGHKTNSSPHEQLPLEEVVDTTKSSEVNGSVSKETDMIEVRNVPDEGNKKGTDDLQNSGDKTEAENNMTFLQSGNHCESALTNNNKGDENTVRTETKQVEESEKKTGCSKPVSAQQTAKAPTTTQSESWALNVLLIGGLSPEHCGDLKQLLTSTLGTNSHRIEPRHKGDSILRVRFRSMDEMEVARVLLHKQIFMGNRLIAEVENLQSQKRKAVMDDIKNPQAKKMKKAPIQPQDKNVSYIKQIAKKTKDVYSRLRHVAKRLRDSYPIYDGLITRRELENNGFVCTLNKFMVCPPNKQFANRCKFSVGKDAVTGKLIVGLPGANGFVNDVTSVPHNFPPHVVKAAKVFEKVICACKQALEDPEGGCQYQIWHELIVRTNVARDLMMVVYLKCPEDLAADKMTLLNKELKEFFENGEGREYRVTSLYTRARTAGKPEQRTLVMGSPYLEETVLGLTLQLLPRVQFWSNISAATMLCKVVQEMLSLTKRISLVEMGFGLGLVGLHLSKFAGEVLSVVAHQTVAEAQNIAACNNIKNTQYFGGSSVEALLQISEKIMCDKACAVVTCNAIHTSTGHTTVEVLRKISKVRRLVLITEMSKACFKFIAAFCNPSKEGGLGNPFFPVRAVPVDTMPNEEGYVLVILMERFGLLSLPKSPGHPKSDFVMHQTEGVPDIRRAAGPFIPHVKEAKRKGDSQVTLNLQGGVREFTGWKKEFKQKQREERLRSLRSFGKCGLKATTSYKHHLVEGQLPYSSDQMSNAEEEYCLRELMAQESRQLQEVHRHAENKKLVRWIEEEQRRWLEREQQIRQVDNEEHRKWIQGEKFRRYMGESGLNRNVGEREFRGEMKEVEFQKWEEDGRERELVGMDPNMRSKDALVQEVIADSLKAAEISHLSTEASQKLKQLVAQAIRTVGVMDRGERHSVTTSSGFGRKSPEDITDSQFGRSDKALPQSRPFDDGYSRHIREVDNPYDHRYNTYGEAGERSEGKKMPQLRYFGEGYSRSVMDVDSQYQRAYSAHEGAVRRDSYQHDLKPQQSIYGARDMPAPHTGVAKTGAQPLRLRRPCGGSSTDVSHMEGNDLQMRYVCPSDLHTSRNQEQKFGQLADNYNRRGNFTADRTRNEHQPSHMRQSIRPAVEQNAGSYVQLREQSWNSSTVHADYIPLSTSMKQLACSTPKPPGTEDIRHPDRNNYIYMESAQRTNRFGVTMHHS